MPNLYQVQDSDRPMWVVADSFEAALAAWRAVIYDENPCNLSREDANHDADCRGTHEVPQPMGVNFICEGDELLVTAVVRAATVYDSQVCAPAEPQESH
jgi:hypothetical protein